MAKSKITRKSAVEAEVVGKKKRSLKKQSLTVRQRTEKGEVQKKRVLRRTASTASKPFRLIGRLIAKILRPFKFVLKPFKTKPFKFIGQILAKILFIGYFKNAWQELKEVTWPGRRETWQLTFAVFVFSIIFGVMITVVDFGLDKLFRKLILER